MIRPRTVLAGWGTALVVLGLILLAFEPTEYVWGLLVGSALALAPFGAIMLLPGRREERALPDMSLPTVVVAAALGLIALGLAVGVWLAAVGAEVLAVGLFVLIRELRAQRRAGRS
ncbi:MAG TPA: hypothetical protein VLB79_09630 [Solirubrobacterales bacterium]|nr:hypothetical protein [Solirubrobacterales bacterium]